MPPLFSLSLLAIVAAALGARLLFAALPLRGTARQLSGAQVALGSAGLAGVGFHCASMFFSRTVALLPGSDTVSTEIRSLGTISLIWYVVAALGVVLALRHQHPAAVAGVLLALTGVGVTMYDGGSLQTHLAAIFVSVLVLGAVVAMLVLPPWQGPPGQT